jgi:hypothetical protein
MGSNPYLDDAKRVLARLFNFVDSVDSVDGVAIISKRDIHVQVLGGNRSIEDTYAVIGLLVKRGYLRTYVVPERQGSGRKPSPRYEVYPGILKSQTHPQNPHNPRNREPGEEG